jgi:lipopolysaccharide/colanic/teichoic acid biosynthesis glycosyltransferase
MSQSAHNEALSREADFPAHFPTASEARLEDDAALRRYRASPGKRILDVVGAIGLMLMMSPFFALIPLLIKIDSRGPVIYTQERVGVNRRRRRRRNEPSEATTDRRRRDRRAEQAEGRPFSIHKFRTMVAGAENDLGPTWATKGDPRVTPVGRFLRAARLDELPQLWNVLRGDMSLVGPRPERPHFVNQFAHDIPRYRSRLFAQPGITGLAQVEHRYDMCKDDVRRKLDYDLDYMKRYSLAHDLRILLKTILVMLTQKGAH